MGGRGITTVYDKYGLVKRERTVFLEERSADEEYQLDFSYDENGRLIYVAETICKVPDGGRGDFSYKYDDDGRLSYMSRECSEANTEYSRTSSGGYFVIGIINYGQDLAYEQRQIDKYGSTIEYWQGDSKYEMVVHYDITGPGPDYSDLFIN